MAQTPKAAMLTVTVRVRLADAGGKRIEIRSDPELSSDAKRRLASAIDPSYVNDIPLGNYVFVRSVRRGIFLERAPRNGEDIALRMLGDLLLPTNELLTALIQTIKEIPTRDVAGRILSEAYRMIGERLVEGGDVTRIRPDFVEWHFCTKVSIEAAVDRAMRKNEPNAHVSLRDAKRDLVVVDRDGKTHAYLEVTRDACPFQVMHLAESTRVFNDLVPDAERRAVIKLFRRLADDARKAWNASEKIRVAYRFDKPSDPPQAREPAIVMQGGEPGEA